MKLYIYDAAGYWHKDQVVTLRSIEDLHPFKPMIIAAAKQRREVRIVDCDDFVTLHIMNGVTLFPTQKEIDEVAAARS